MRCYQKRIKEQNGLSFSIFLVLSYNIDIIVILLKIPCIILNNNIQNIVHHLILIETH